MQEGLHNKSTSLSLRITLFASWRKTLAAARTRSPHLLAGYNLGRFSRCPIRETIDGLTRIRKYSLTTSMLNRSSSSAPLTAFCMYESVKRPCKSWGPWSSLQWLRVLVWQTTSPLSSGHYSFCPYEPGIRSILGDLLMNWTMSTFRS